MLRPRAADPADAQHLVSSGCPPRSGHAGEGPKRISAERGSTVCRCRCNKERGPGYLFRSKKPAPPPLCCADSPEAKAVVFSSQPKRRDNPGRAYSHVTFSLREIDSMPAMAVVERECTDGGSCRVAGLGVSQRDAGSRSSFRFARAAGSGDWQTAATRASLGRFTTSAAGQSMIGMRRNQGKAARSRMGMAPTKGYSRRRKGAEQGALEGSRSLASGL
ncbi:hypothetical protein BH20ACT22_BH20ACT22_04410 [soil metagenome]